MSMYKIGVEIAMHGNASSFLGMIVKDLIGLNGHVDKAVAGLGRVKMAMAGVGSMMAGGAILGGLSHIEAAGEVLVNAKTQLEASLPLHQRALDMALATKAAWAETARNQQTTVAENIDALKHLQNITQNMGHSIEMLPIMNDLKTTIQNASNKNGKPLSSSAAEESAMNFTRGIELVKGNNIADILRVVPELQRTVIGLGGRVNGSQYLAQVQAAGAAGIQWNDTMLTKTLPALMLVSRQAGVILAAGHKAFVSGNASNSDVIADNRVKWGFQKEDDYVDPSKHNRGFKYGSGFEADKMMEDVGAWGKDVREMLRAKGVDVDNAKELSKVISEISSSNKSLGKFLDEVLLPKQSAALQNETSKAASVSNDASSVLKQSPAAVRAALSSQFETALQGFGEQLAPTVLPMLKTITDILTEVNKWEAANPEKLAMIGAALTGIGAGLVAIGAVLLGGALLSAIGVGGWLVVGLAALAAALGAGGVLAAKHSAAMSNDQASKALENPNRGFEHENADEAPKVIGGFGDSIKAAWDGLVAKLPTRESISAAMDVIGAELSAAIASIPGKCAAAIAGLVSGLAGAIGAAIKGGLKGMGSDPGGGPRGFPGTSGPIGKQSSNGPVMSGTQKTALNGNVYLSGRDVGRIALNDVAASETRASSTSHYDTSLHPDYMSS